MSVATLGSQPKRNTVFLAWGMLFVFLAGSAWLLWEVLLPASASIGCFDGWEVACSAEPTPAWVKATLWGLWVTTGILAIVNIALARRLRGGKLAAVWSTATAIATVGAGCAFVVAAVLLP